MLCFLPAATPLGSNHNLRSATPAWVKHTQHGCCLVLDKTAGGFDFQRAGFDLVQFSCPTPTPTIPLTIELEKGEMSKDIWFLLDLSALLGARPLTLTDFPNGVNSPGIAGVVPVASVQASEEFGQGRLLSFATRIALDWRAEQE